MTDNTKRVGRWYFGGIASAMAACCTHPLDLLKVRAVLMCIELRKQILIIKRNIELIQRFISYNK